MLKPHTVALLIVGLASLACGSSDKSGDGVQPPADGGAGGSSPGAGGSGGSQSGGTQNGGSVGSGGSPYIPPGEPTPIPTTCTPDPAGPDDGVRIKSPGPQMRFTEGLPFRILADNADPNEWMCEPGHPPYVCPGTEMRFYVDDILVGSQPPNPNEQSHFELRLLEGLPTGDHDLTVSYVQYDPDTMGAGPVVDGALTITVSVDPLPEHANTLTLDADLELSGSTPLDWQDTIVIGNGHKVTASDGYSGAVTIKNAFVTGLADYDQWGIEITTTGGVTIQDSVFEATAALKLTEHGSEPIVLINNEFRANNFVTYVASEPQRTPVLQLSGDTSANKVFQSNRLGGGIVRFENTDDWQVGGLGAGEGNILIGPRAVIEYVNTTGMIIQGNYDLHDYHGGWSQGFNQYFEGSDGALLEHNVIRSGSWPIQTFGGEFRYNLVVDSGHDWWRSARDGVKIHHNMFVHTTGPDGGFNGGIMVYSGESGLEIYNNVFDGGGETGQFYAPAISIGDNSTFASLRNNVFTGFSDVIESTGSGTVSGSASASLGYADYNAWFNPLATETSNYSDGLVAGTAGEHDVQGDPTWAGTPEIPYPISAGCIWSRTYTTAQVLAHYRQIYSPGDGSPLIGAGDPNDGANQNIGAIGLGESDPSDQFGRVLP